MKSSRLGQVDFQCELHPFLSAYHELLSQGFYGTIWTLLLLQASLINLAVPLTAFMAFFWGFVGAGMTV